VEPDSIVRAMARIEGVPRARASLLTRIVYWMSERMFKRLPEPVTVSAHNPQIFRAIVGYEYFLAKADRVAPSLKALAGVKAATMVGCPF
jgi:hypothetical protein